MTDERITVRLEQEMRKELHAFAGFSNVSEAAVVRDAIGAYLKRQDKPPSCLELADRMGILGSLDELPTDLSTNKAHFDGFGLS